MKRILRVGCLCALPAACSALAAGPSPSKDSRTPDCGVNALSILLRLDGRPATLDRITSALPERHPSGYSMAELSDAAKRLGLRLEGVRLTKAETPLDRPAIAFLNDARGGHFAVLRPVGTTGTLVQVIDPPHPPWITDYDRILAARPWTGKVLVPASGWPPRPMAAALVGCAGAVLIGLGLRRGNRSPNASSGGAPEPSEPTNGHASEAAAPG